MNKHKNKLKRLNNDVENLIGSKIQFSNGLSGIINYVKLGSSGYPDTLEVLNYNHIKSNSTGYKYTLVALNDNNINDIEKEYFPELESK